MIEAQLFQPTIERKLLGVKGRSGLIAVDFDEFVVRNQEQFGRGTSDYVSMVMAHRGISSLDRVLGIREATIRRCALDLNGEIVEFVEARPFTRNIWIGEYVRLISRDEAAKMPYAGQTALSWATVNNQVPKLIVRADNGYFYPATPLDIVKNEKI